MKSKIKRDLLVAIMVLLFVGFSTIHGFESATGAETEQGQGNTTIEVPTEEIRDTDIPLSGGLTDWNFNGNKVETTQKEETIPDEKVPQTNVGGNGQLQLQDPVQGIQQVVDSMNSGSGGSQGSDSSADGTSSENTSSESTSSENASSDNTSSDAASSDNTSSDGTSSDATSSDGASSDGASSDNTSSDGASSDTSSSDNASSDGASSDGASSDNTSSDMTSSDNASSGDIDSNGTSSDSVTSEGTSSSNGTVSDGASSDSSAPEDSTSSQPDKIEKPAPIVPDQRNVIEWLAEQLRTPGTVAHDYFETRGKGASLDSTGYNFAPEINAAMAAAGYVSEDSSYSWRIYKCGDLAGSLETGYNIFWTNDSVGKMKVGERIDEVVRYNTDTKVYTEGYSKVINKVVEGKNVHMISGGDFGRYATDLTLEAANRIISGYEKCTTDNERRSYLGITNTNFSNDSFRALMVGELGPKALTYGDDDRLSVQAYFLQNAENKNSRVAMLYLSKSDVITQNAAEKWKACYVYVGGQWFQSTKTDKSGEVDSISIASVNGKALYLLNEQQVFAALQSSPDWVETDLIR